jgi:glycosyltransferase involved in cell wall biosynthesis
MGASPSDSRATISVVCGCMDRDQMLRQALPSWLAMPEIDEVVIVDWSSTHPVRRALAPIADPRVNVVRVEGQRRWNASKSHNLGIRVASGEVLLRLDSDYVLEPTFLQKHALPDRAFFAGNWRRARSDNERHLTGALYIHKRHLLGVNGYNERIVTYGYEDDDLFERLAAAGLTRRDIDLDTVHHLPHDDMLRTRNQDVVNLYAETERNKLLAHAHPWSTFDRMTDWARREDEDGSAVWIETTGSAP